MKTRLHTALWLLFFFCLIALASFSHAPAVASAGSPPVVGSSKSSKSATTDAVSLPPVNKIIVGQCAGGGVETDPEKLRIGEGRHGLVIDARPSAINQSTGKLSFDGNTGRVTVLHMNPFAFSYTLSVEQKELVTTALNNFVKLLLPESITKPVGLESGTAGGPLIAARHVNKLLLIESRLRTFDPSKCDHAAAPKACDAASAMKDVFDQLMTSDLVTQSGPIFDSISRSTIKKGGHDFSAKQAFDDYTDALGKLKDPEAESHTTCDRATDLNADLGSFDFKSYFDGLDTAQKEIDAVTSEAQDLNRLADDFQSDEVLKDVKTVPRCGGFNCATEFKAFATAVLELVNVQNGYPVKVKTLHDNAEAMQKMLRLTDDMKSKEGLFARTFTIIKKFELTEATVTLSSTKLPDTTAGQASGLGPQSGTPPARGGSPSPTVAGGQPSEGSAGGNSNGGNTDGGGKGGPSTNNDSDTLSGNNPPGGSTPAGQVKEVVRIGKPRFTLSAGMVYSPLPRRTFESVKGFTHDAQGNPTGNGSTDIVGLGENSSRRLLPMLILNSRLANVNPFSLNFSLGITAKRDKDIDVEYLLGPSVGALRDRVMLTFGAYAGQTQKLVRDVKLGDELPDSVGDAKLFRKGYTWKPGFSFSYVFSDASKKKAEAQGGGGSGAGSSAPGVRNELRIGSIPFNLAIGLGYTSLEQRTYDAVVGLARDRQGNLTNGQTLTRVVGLTSSSSYRLTPLAMLHSRLTNFRRGPDFYFTTGVTGKKTDKDFDIEYLLGGSINVYHRKAFLTFGTFAGKQQTLGGDLFEGAQLGKTQGVTTINRYVWKPAFSFSYDITKIVKRDQ